MPLCAQGGVMAKFRYEMFGHLVYDDSLTYEELIAREEQLTTEFSARLKGMEASHIHFEPQGDALYVQCVFAEKDANDFESVCHSLCELVGKEVAARLLFVGKELDGLWCFFIHNGLCQTAELCLPSPRLGLARRAPRLLYKREARHKAVNSPEMDSETFSGNTDCACAQ